MKAIVKILAADTPSDIVLDAARKMGFSKFRESSKGYCLRWAGSGPGMSIAGCVEMFNILLKKQLSPGDKNFAHAGFNGRSAATSATIRGITYIVEFEAGFIVVTKVPTKRRTSSVKK